MLKVLSCGVTIIKIGRGRICSDKKTARTTTPTGNSGTRVREKARDAFQIGDALLVGHIAIFREVKNQPYLVEIFADFHRRYPDSKLMLVSDGPMFEAVKHQVEQLGLTESKAELLICTLRIEHK